MKRDLQPFVDSPTSWTVSVGTVSLISLAVELTESGAKAKLFHHMRGTLRGTPVFWEMDLRVRPTATFRSSHKMVPNLLLEPSTSTETKLDFFLQEGLNLALHWMGTRSDKRSLPEARLAESFQRMQAHLRERLLPRASEAARRFSPSQEQALRWEVYSMVAGEPTGRLGQMASAFPGLIAIALDLRKSLPGACRELLGAIVSGQALEEILDLAAGFRSSQTRMAHPPRHNVAGLESCVSQNPFGLGSLEPAPASCSSANEIRVRQVSFPWATAESLPPEADGKAPRAPGKRRTAPALRGKAGRFIQAGLDDLPFLAAA